MNNINCILNKLNNNIDDTNIIELFPDDDELIYLIETIKCFKKSIHKISFFLTLIETFILTLNTIANNLIELKNIVISASNSINEDNVRIRLNNRFQQLLEQIDHLSKNSSYENYFILNGEFKCIHIDIHTIEKIKIKYYNTTIAGLLLEDTDVLTSDNAILVNCSVNDAIEYVNIIRNELNSFNVKIKNYSNLLKLKEEHFNDKFSEWKCLKIKHYNKVLEIYKEDCIDKIKIIINEQLIKNN
jgi:hypothetical protein